MHESSLMADLLRKIEAIAQDHGARRILAVKVNLGALSNMSPEHFREHFALAARRTPAEQARLEVDVVPDLTDPLAQHVVLESVEVEA